MVPEGQVMGSELPECARKEMIWAANVPGLNFNVYTEGGSKMRNLSKTRILPHSKHTQ